MKNKTVPLKTFMTAAQNLKEKNFWLNKFSGEWQKSNFYYDIKSTAGKNRVFRNEKFNIPRELSEKFIQMSGKSDIRLHMILAVGLVILIEKYTDRKDIIIGTPVYKQDIEGKFINTVLVLRNPLHDRITFKELLLQEREIIREAIEHINYPMEILPEQLGMPTSEEDDFPLFDISILLENIQDKKYIEHIQHNVMFSFMRKDNQLEGNIRYNSSRNHKEIITRIIEHFIIIFKQVLFDADLALSQIEILAEEEKRELLYAFNHTKTGSPFNKTIHGMFEDQVEKTPGKTAVCSPIDFTDIFKDTYCFRKNPYAYEADLDDAYGPDKTKTTGKVNLKLLKTHHHNCVIVNHNMLKFINLFDGRASLESIFSRMSDIKDIKLVWYPVETNDLLEITHDFSHQADIHSHLGYMDFILLVKLLYKHNVIELAATQPSQADHQKLSPGDFDSDELFDSSTGWKEQFTKDEYKTPGADVLLLGDTPGMPSTGLLYIGSYLRRNGVKACCRFYDDSGDYSSMKKNIRELLAKIQPKIVGISLKWFPYIARVLDMCSIIREYAGENALSVKIVLGGNTAAYYGEELIQYDGIDYIIRGDGELPLLKICQGENETRIPNCVYKKDKKVYQNPVTYSKDETNSPDIYLSQLDQIMLSNKKSLLGTFFIYTHLGCGMNCFYCGGCSRAQQKAFNRKRVFMRPEEEVRKDITAALPYASTLQFDFDVAHKDLAGYCKNIWSGIDLSGHFCLLNSLKAPSAALIELAAQTFKYVYWDLDILTLSQRQRRQLFSSGLVKPQLTDEEILAVLHQCDRYDNVEVRLNLINGLPYSLPGDTAEADKLLDTIMFSNRSFSHLHWARLHAQPGAPILENAEEYDMYSFALTFSDFLEYSKKNFNSQSLHQQLEHLNYPYVYYKDETHNSKVTLYYTETNRKVQQYRADRKKRRMPGETLTYRQMDQKANQLAHYLRANGVTADTISAIMLPPSIRIPLAIIGVLKAGGGYLPIDPQLPASRISVILEDSQTSVLISQSHIIEEKSLKDDKEQLLSLDNLEEILAEESTAKPEPISQPFHSVYTIYTSGSTGKPKGVILTHENLVNYVHWFTRETRLTEQDKTMLTSSFAFDLGYTSLYPSLLVGGECHILPRDIYMSLEKLLHYIDQKGITYIKITPSLLKPIVNHPGFSAKKCQTLRLAVVGGEAINLEDIETARSISPHMEIMNHYGPTEATIGCVARYIDFNRFEDYKITPTIGRPIANTRIYILNKDFNLQPIGLPGELCISGTGLARGYLNRPGLTAEKFCLRRPGTLFEKTAPGSRKNFSLEGTVSHDDASSPGDDEIKKTSESSVNSVAKINFMAAKKNMQSCSHAAMPSPHSPHSPYSTYSTYSTTYHTGDMARWLPDGNIEFLGRIDNQVKIRGYRVELEDIKNQLLKHPQIKEAFITVNEQKNKTGGNELRAYFVPQNQEIEENEDNDKKIFSLKEIEEKEKLYKREKDNSVFEQNTPQTITGYFHERVKKFHDKSVIGTKGNTRTYDAINNDANRLAHAILEKYDDRFKLSKDEEQRYKRQMLLYGWGIASQEKLKGTTVFVAGADGGGSATIMQLALAGFGTIKICDFDVVELSNLFRQFLHDEAQINMNKILSAQQTINRINPNVNVIPITGKLTEDNVFELVGDAEIIFDMFDGPVDKFILSQCAVVKQIPHVIISMADINAYTVVCHTPHTPCYHCIFDKKKLNTITAGMQSHVENYRKNPFPVAATSLFISTGTAINEALKILLGFKNPAYNKFFYFNQRGEEENFVYTPGYKAMTYLFSDHFLQLCKEQGFDWDIGWRGNFIEELKLTRDPNCPLCGEKAREKRSTLEQHMKKQTAHMLASLPQQEQSKKKTHTHQNQIQTAALLPEDDDLYNAAAIMGILKAGKTYVPLDPTLPADRLCHILELSEARIIVAGEKHLQMAEKISNKVNKNIKIIHGSEILKTPISIQAQENPQVEIAAHDTACILFSPDPAAPRERIMQSHKEILHFIQRYADHLPSLGKYEYDLTLAKVTLLASLLKKDINVDPGLSFSFESNQKQEPDGYSFSNLRDFLSKELPDFMIPSYFIQLKEMPLTPNGKIDRKALPEPKIGMSISSSEYSPPRDEVDRKLVQTWAKILGIEKEKISIDSNFFQLGGNSLNLLLLVSKIHQEFGLEMDVTKIFDSPTIKDISIGIKTRKLTDEPVALLNQLKPGKIFCFPPLVGYGAVYKELALKIKDFSLYAFNFIEEDNRLEQYLHLITTHQSVGPYILLGWSAAGPLIFEVAKTLENHDYMVSDIILLDCFRHENEEGVGQQEIDQYQREFLMGIDKLLKEIGLEFLKEKVKERTIRYNKYFMGITSLEKINANVHLILSEDERKAGMTEMWDPFTREKPLIYQGFGSHIDMLSPGVLEKNVGIITQILKKDL